MCGILGVTLPPSAGEFEAARQSFFGMFALQHRGQEGAGLATADGAGARILKDTGLVTQLLTEERLRQLPGHHAIGHTRYSTTGSSVVRNAQPFLVETRHGPLGMVHNGNLVNAGELRDDLLARGFPLAATSDSEVMLLMLASAGGTTWEERVERTMPGWKGAYSLVILVSDRILAVRDPWGFRPLSIGRLPEGGWATASETCALTTLGCSDIREVEPGEIVTLSGDSMVGQRSLFGSPTLARCTFEHVYFSRPDSVWDGTSVHHVRQRLGELLAEEAPVDADVIVPVPDSSIPAAIGYAQRSGIPFNDGFIKNRYIGRTFIEPTQAMREHAVAMKFNVLRENLEGRRVVMIDDSIVRGTTAGPLVRMLREGGATEVHVRVTCPPITSPCHMGLDMGTHEELISHRMDVEELRAYIGADSLSFLSLPSMMKAIGRTDGYCNACFTGEYPVPVPVTIGRTKQLFEGVLR
jgi:amidophosphoribosyltransferase